MRRVEEAFGGSSFLLDGEFGDTSSESVRTLGGSGGAKTASVIDSSRHTVQYVNQFTQGSDIDPFSLFGNY